jgi:hypothetical protein
MVRKMDAMGSRNGEWKLGKNPIYSCRAHIATSFVLAASVSSRADREEIEQLREHEASVSRRASFRLVVRTSCIAIGFKILDRVGTGGRTGGLGGFLSGVGPNAWAIQRKARVHARL